MMLTDVKIKNLQAKTKPYKVFDGNGLYIEISSLGKRHGE